MYHIAYHPTGIQALPVELLTRIFVLGSLCEYPYTDGSPFLLKPDQHYYPVPSANFQLLVSHVCRQWRQIALRTSSLWTRLHFREPSHLSRAQAFLERSRGPAFAQTLDILVDTVSKEEHIPGVNLYKEQLHAVFQLIVPHVYRWRAFHLKIRDHDCKAVARFYLSSCGPAPCLETLQLYHFEDYRTSQNLYLATYRPPVVVFSNHLPRLTNVSLIGVNLPWEKSPYLVGLRNLELALHSDNIRPPYGSWDAILRNSPALTSLTLHYSGPRLANGDAATIWPSTKERLCLQSLEELTLTDLDPDYLCLLMERMVMPSVMRLSLDLPEQDFTSFVELISGGPHLTYNHRGQVDDTQDVDASSLSSASISTPSPSHSSVVNAPVVPYISPINLTTAELEGGVRGTLSPVSPASALALAISSRGCSTSPSPLPFLGRLESLTISALECDTSTWRMLLKPLYGLRLLEINFAKVGERLLPALMEGYTEKSESHHRLSDRESHIPLLPNLHTFRISGLQGKALSKLIAYRQGFANGHGVKRWMVKWCESWKGRDQILDDLVENGWAADANLRAEGHERGIGPTKKVAVEWYPPGPEEEEEDGEEDDDEVSDSGDDEQEDVGSVAPYNAVNGGLSFSNPSVVATSSSSDQQGHSEGYEADEPVESEYESEGGHTSG